MKIRWIPEVVGATLLLLFPMLAPLVTPGYLFVYHHQLPLTKLIAGLALDALGIAVAGMMMLVILSGLGSVPRRLMGGLLAGLFLWCIAYNAYALSLLNIWPALNLTTAPRASFLTALAAWYHRWNFRLVIAVPSVMAALAWLKPGMARPMIRATRLALTMVAFCALWIVPEIAVLDWRAHEPTATVEAHAETQPVRSTRIVWVLFDELSYKLTLSDPPDGLQFPNLKRLHAQSISFGNLEPVANYTDLVIPSLLGRRSIEQIRSTPESRLIYLDRVTHKWAAYDASQTLFANAQRYGWNPGVVGWMIPYCRLFAGILTNCFWEPGAAAGLPFESWVSNRDSTFSYAVALPRAFAAEVHSRRHVDEKRRLDWILDYASLMEHLKTTLRDERIHFIYAHLPVPHPPGIYDRRTHQLCGCGNYLDNLALADDTLGTLMREIEESSGADPTTVIVSSDHSWRVPMWRNTINWTAEEERVSRGQFDTRPVFMIHFAGQKSGSEIAAPMPELVEHDVIEGMLEGKVIGPEDVERLAGSDRMAAKGPE